MKKHDIFLISSLLVIAVVLVIFVQIKQNDGAYAVVKINGKECGKYDISKEGEYKLNDGTNILHIKDGKAWIEEANCPDKLCVKQGKISKTGQVITCLPNKLTVTVFNAEKGAELLG